MVKNEKIVIAGIVLAVVAFALLHIDQGARHSMIPQADLLLPQGMTDFANFSIWKKQADFQSLFNFYRPDTVGLKTVNVDHTFHLVSATKADEPLLVVIDKLSYAEFQKNKSDLDKQDEKQFGWTNAYGASVFEYRKDTLTAFVVDKEKKAVLKLSTSDTKNFNLLENITKTFQTTAKETDLHGSWYVNFPGGYKLRYTSDLELKTDDPFVSTAEWQLKNPKKIGHIQFNVSDTHPDGGPLDVVRKLKADGVEATMYQYDDLNSGILWQKGDTYFSLTAQADTPQNIQVMNNLMVQMIASFRFLTDQEKVH
ncbi:MAG: hypothetical protein ABI425_05645 [Patescibacteria group bacterium]